MWLFKKFAGYASDWDAEDHCATVEYFESWVGYSEWDVAIGAFRGSITASSRKGQAPGPPPATHTKHRRDSVGVRLTQFSADAPYSLFSCRFPYQDEWLDDYRGYSDGLRNLVYNKL